MHHHIMKLSKPSTHILKPPYTRWRAFWQTLPAQLGAQNMLHFAHTVISYCYINYIFNAILEIFFGQSLKTHNLLITHTVPPKGMGYDRFHCNVCDKWRVDAYCSAEDSSIVLVLTRTRKIIIQVALKVENIRIRLSILTHVRLIICHPACSSGENKFAGEYGTVSFEEDVYLSFSRSRSGPLAMH